MSVMKKEEILKERFWVMPLHAILRVLDKLPGVINNIIFYLILVVPLCIVSLILLALVFSPGVLFVLLVTSLLDDYDVYWIIGFPCVLFVAVCLSVFIGSSKPFVKIKEKLYSWVDPLGERTRFLRQFNLNLSGRFLQHYEKRWGMTNEDIKDYISHRAQLGGDVSISHLLPFVSQLCKLNKGAREEQETLLAGFFNEDEIEYVFNNMGYFFNMEYSYSHYQYWRGKELGKKKTLMELLFKLTVEQDGIHNDEWKLLIQIMTQLKFNNRYIEYFKNRYSPLRTEFDDYERKSTSSMGEYSTAGLESYYAVLGVEKDASIEEIKRAYHELAMQHHPDLPKNANRKEECEAKMMEINEAYEKVRG